MQNSITTQDYREKPLFNLFILISEKSDKIALHELLTYRKIFWYSKRHLILLKFLLAIKNWQLDKNHMKDEIIDCAYNKTVDKFTNLPSSINTRQSSNNTSINRSLKSGCTDCRYYYRAMISLIEKWQKNNPDSSSIKLELKVAELFQKFAIKHFYLSIKECQRELMPFTKRYFWKTKGKMIILKCPVELPGREFRKWLEHNISDPDPNRPGEKERVQALVDRYFARSEFINREIDELDNESITSGYSNFDDQVKGWTSSLAKDLAVAIARDKVIDINKLRPAIKKLGQEKLYSLVLRIFKDIDDGIFEDNRIASDFSLSKSTFSRFAGSMWTANKPDAVHGIPDLWANTAKVLTSDVEFIEAVSEAGLLSKLKQIVNIGD